MSLRIALLASLFSSAPAWAAGPARLVFTQQPSANTPTNVAFERQPVVSVVDSYGNPTLVDGCVVTISLLGSGTASTLFGTLSKTTAAGQADFGGSHLRVSLFNTRGSSFRLAAQASCVPNTLAMSDAFTVSLSGVPSQLAVLRNGSASPLNKVWTRQPVVEVLDENGNRVSQDNETVVAVTARPPAGAHGTVVGTAQVKVANGVATFSDLQVSGQSLADSGTYLLQFSAIHPGVDSLTGATAWQEINAVGLVPHEIAFGEPPASVARNQTLPPVVIEVRDAKHFLCFHDNATSVRLQLAKAPAGAKMYHNGSLVGGVGSSTGPQTAVNGEARFSGLRFDVPGMYVLRATSRVGFAESSAFAVVSYGAASHLRFVQQPCDHAGNQRVEGVTICDGLGAGNGISAAWAQAPKVEVLDASDNRVTGDSSTTVTLACVAPFTTPACTLFGTVSATAVNGVADFASANLRTSLTMAPANGVVIRATSSPALLPDMSNTFNDD